MKFSKNKKNLILGISITIFLCILCCIIFFFITNRTVETTSNSVNLETNTIETNNSETDNIITVILDDDTDKETSESTKDKSTTKKESNKNTTTKKEEPKSTSPYYIKVNYKANVVTIYKKDENGKYTIPYKAMVCSCGTYTPKSGTYQTTNKYTWRPLLHDVYGQYATRIVRKILFHSVPYSSNKKDTLLYEEYDKLGTTASDGCVRLTVEDAKWIYDNCPYGTSVEFYSDSNPGPLGKPSAQKISSVLECRNWDPTDPSSNNPWHTYQKEEEKPVPNTPNTPNTDTPTTDEPSTDTPTTDTPSTDEPSTDTPTPDIPSTDEPSIDTPPIDTPSTDEPTVDTPTTDEPTTDIPTPDEPSIDEPTIDSPSIDTENTMIIQ